MGIPFGYSPLLSLVPRTYFRWASCWNFPVGASELIPFVACSDRFCYSRSAEIPSQGFLLVFPRWGFTLIVRSQGTQFSPVEGLLFFSFLGELHKESYIATTTRVLFTKGNIPVPLPFSGAPRIVLDLERTQELLQLTALGGYHADTGGTPHPFPQMLEVWEPSPAVAPQYSSL